MTEQLHEQDGQPDVADELRKAIAVVEEDYIPPFENPDFIVSKDLDAKSPGKRQRALEIFREEAAALRALDPATATIEDIRAIRASFEGQIEAL